MTEPSCLANPTKHRAEEEDKPLELATVGSNNDDKHDEGDAFSSSANKNPPSLLQLLNITKAENTTLLPDFLTSSCSERFDLSAACQQALEISQTCDEDRSPSLSLLKDVFGANPHEYSPLLLQVLIFLPSASDLARCALVSRSLRPTVDHAVEQQLVEWCGGRRHYKRLTRLAGQSRSQQLVALQLLTEVDARKLREWLERTDNNDEIHVGVLSRFDTCYADYAEHFRLAPQPSQSYLVVTVSHGDQARIPAVVSFYSDTVATTLQGVDHQPYVVKVPCDFFHINNHTSKFFLFHRVFHGPLRSTLAQATRGLAVDLGTYDEVACYRQSMAARVYAQEVQQYQTCARTYAVFYDKYHLGQPLPDCRHIGLEFLTATGGQTPIVSSS